MTTYTCDICGQPAKRADHLSHEVETFTLRCDPLARIEVRVSWGFVHHSISYGGPPDLCPDCLRLTLTGLIKAQFP